MSDCHLENYLVIAGLGLIFIHIAYSAIRSSVEKQKQREQEELYRLRLRYNPDAIKQAQELARLRQLEARYSLKETPDV